MSNALLVSARERVGHPIAVFGPQTAYFAPQLLMEQDVHGAGIDARGVAFPGSNLYVQLGRGRDYAWSATSAGQDIVDTFAVSSASRRRAPTTTRRTTLPGPVRADRDARAHEPGRRTPADQTAPGS